MTKGALGWLSWGMLVAACGDGAGAPDGNDVADVTDGDDAIDPDMTDDTADPDTVHPETIDTRDTADVAPDRHCVGPAPVAGTARLVHTLGVADVTIADRDTCARTYVLASTATRRDDLPASPRTFTEAPDDPVLRSGHDLFDALYALAHAEAHEAEVTTIRDGAFAGGASVPCGGDAGCWETGRKWTYVWTRDTAFAVDLGLAATDPARAAASLAFKLSPTRAGDRTFIVQDTGSGGSYPVSTDRVAWALGARQVLLQLVGPARDTFRDAAWDALATTLEHDRRVVWDWTTGLYRGETSFLDWREQTYAAWTLNDVIDIASGAALGTNVLHLHALRLAAELAREVGDARATTFTAWADDLRAAIRARFWLADDQLFASFLPATLDPAPVRRFDLLGLSLAILHGVATADEARAIVAAYPHYGPGAPVIWPQQQFTPIYHNRAEWPFVDAYWLRAARVAKNDAVTDRMVRALVRGAALNLSHMENAEAATGAPWLDDGSASGPVVNSQRQLWSIGGYLSMVEHTLFGLRPTSTGLVVDPWLTHGLRRDLFAGSDRLVLDGFRHRGRRLTIALDLPLLDSPALPGGHGALRVRTRTIGGATFDGPEIPDAALVDGAVIEVALEHDPDVPAGTVRVVDPSDWRAVFGPRTPQVRSITTDGGKLRVALGLGGESPDGVALDVYRDGTRVAEGLPATTESWLDPDPAVGSPCYTVEAVFTATGNRSQHARGVCWWGEGDAAIQTIDARSFEAVGGTPSEANGRFHYQDWGDPGHTLTARAFRPSRSGPHLVQVLYANGAGPINTGIACGVKRVVVTDEAGGEVVGDGVLVMPQLGRWDRWAMSSFVPVTLEAGKTYRFEITGDATTINMSELAHFATYNGTGGRDGPFARVDIAELRVLAKALALPRANDQ